VHVSATALHAFPFLHFIAVQRTAMCRRTHCGQGLDVVTNESLLYDHCWQAAVRSEAALNLGHYRRLRHLLVTGPEWSRFSPGRADPIHGQNFAHVARHSTAGHSHLSLLLSCLEAGATHLPVGQRL
jgi:hypothetical protein